MRKACFPGHIPKVMIDWDGQHAKKRQYIRRDTCLEAYGNRNSKSELGK